MASEKDQRQNVALGFQGGAGLSLRLKPKDAEKLFAQLAEGGWHETEDASGPVRIDLSQVVFVRAEREEHRVGFGG
ncbi:unannotated protein [freshwater metagenome]|uniref:Unannotated protein n=1 Tax=freshwater metagenome TaxID=449393 RepID=A0A6J7CQ77_9ZZZZ|nr:hypothetical protein [Actinomycetota bacterium]